MNPNFNWAIVAERMQALQSEADARRPAPGTRLASGVAPPAPGWPAVPAGGWRSPRSARRDSTRGTTREIMIKAVEEQ